MSRLIISKDNLIDLINQEIDKVAAIKGCKVSGVYSLREADENGCNWSLGYFNTGIIPAEVSRPLIQNLIVNMQSRYNIEEIGIAESKPKNSLHTIPSDIPDRSLMHIGFTVDTNCVNAKQRMNEMNQLEQWAQDGLIQLVTSEIALEEMAAGSNVDRTRKAYSFFYTKSAPTTDSEQRLIKLIEEAIFPGGAVTQNQKNDVEIVFNAGKYSYPLITNDGASKSQPGGILGNKKALLSLGIHVVTPGEAVSTVEKAIQKRDAFARQWASINKEELPVWVGQD